MYRNTKNVPYYIFGQGSFAQLPDLLKPRREAVDGPVVFFVDHFFRNHELTQRLPMEKGDQLIFVDTSSEPEVNYMDELKASVVAADDRLPCCVVGIGGGATLDTAKAVANLGSPIPAGPKTIRAGNWSRIPPCTRSAFPLCPEQVRNVPAPAYLPIFPRNSNWA